MTTPFYNVSVRFTRDVEAGKDLCWPVHKHPGDNESHVCSIACGYHDDTRYSFRELGDVVNAVYRQCGCQIYEVCVCPAPMIPGCDFDPNENEARGVAGGSTETEGGYLMCH